MKGKKAKSNKQRLYNRLYHLLNQAELTELQEGSRVLGHYFGYKLRKETSEGILTVGIEYIPPSDGDDGFYSLYASLKNQGTIAEVFHSVERSERIYSSGGRLEKLYEHICTKKSNKKKEEELANLEKLLDEK